MICNCQSLPDCWTVNTFSNDYNMVNASENSVMVITKLMKSSSPVAPFILLRLSSCAYSRSNSASSWWKWVSSLRNLDAFRTSQLHSYPFSSNRVWASPSFVLNIYIPTIPWTCASSPKSYTKVVISIEKNLFASKNKSLFTTNFAS